MSNELTLKDLLKAGAHFGHQTRKWNPKMKPYIYGERNGIYIIDLGQTLLQAQKAYEFIKKTVAAGKCVLFVGTKRQATDAVREAAKASGAFHVTHRWLGGMLTNFKTISLSIDKIRKFEKMKENGDYNLLTKKEQIKVEKEIVKLDRALGGIKEMRKLPGAIFVVDPNVENIAVKEANVLGIPVIALIDTNCDPTGIEYVVPANDDAIRSITLFTNYFANAVVEGMSKVGKVGGKGKEGDGEMRDHALEAEILKKLEEDVELQQQE